MLKNQNIFGREYSTLGCTEPENADFHFDPPTERVGGYSDEPGVHPSLRP